MEDALREVRPIVDSLQHAKVLILILMEDALRDRIPRGGETYCVLILILMEDALRVYPSECYHQTDSLS